jgi:dihydropteroate synthase
MYWQTTRYKLSLTRPLVMGIVNATPDSFSDGGQHGTSAQAMAWCDRLVREGADILDIGGESTRPGGHAPDRDEELRRVLPVVRHAVTLGRPVSVDTSRPEVMAEAIAAGADIINDVRALRRPGALAVLADAPDTGVCLMHMRGEPDTMQQHTTYGDVVHEVALALGQRMREVVDAGVQIERISLDPGIGFAKTAEQNWQLMRRQGELCAIGRPLLVGWSRKSALGVLTGRPVHDRLGASVAAALAAVCRGAHIVRVHDVAATVDALKVAAAAGLIGG